MSSVCAALEQFEATKAKSGTPPVLEPEVVEAVTQVLQ